MNLVQVMGIILTTNHPVGGSNDQIEIEREGGNPSQIMKPNAWEAFRFHRSVHIIRADDYF